MSLADKIKALQAQANTERMVMETQKRIYTRSKINPMDWEKVAAALETMFPGEFEPHQKPMFNGGVNKHGQSNVVAAFKADFPISRTITVFRNGTITGDGIDIEPILKAM
mgnify:FL=1